MQLRHIAIIPDGNRRWAKQQGKMAVEGHKYAVENTLPALYDELLALKIPYCTFWAMSPENFIKRTSFEVNNLLYLLRHFLQVRLDDMHKKNIKICAIGDILKLPANTQVSIQHAIEKTKENTGMVFVFAINYGGRDEIVRAIRQAIKLHLQDVSKESFTDLLDTTGIPDADLIIRTGGEKRTSGFLLWQSEYAEYIFLDKLFPDITPQDLRDSIEEFYNRKRRYGS
ncbi:di-trans,poly-cis-decaprenylcistransferase [Candidatus Woesebacteria bacterium]|nr:di-trans,poly-cis-decaprenylcistransferase [Candidatus Woesebacteria bacterium]